MKARSVLRACLKFLREAHCVRKAVAARRKAQGYLVVSRGDFEHALRLKP